MLELSEAERCYLKVFERLRKPSQNFYHTRYPRRFIQHDYGFSLLLPSQLIYNKYGSDYPRILRSEGDNGLQSVIAIDTKESTLPINVLVMEELTNKHLSALEKFSRKIEAELEHPSQPIRLKLRRILTSLFSRIKRYN